MRKRCLQRMEEKEREEYEAAVYLRLSKEDGDICNGGYKGESNSITNQKRLIYDFLKGREEIHIYKEYVDDGYSGSDFLRPAFRQMIKEMEEGKVNLAQIPGHFEDMEEQREIVSAFHETIQEVKTRTERGQALKDTILKLKENHIQMLSENRDPDGMQERFSQMLQEKKMVEALR